MKIAEFEVETWMTDHENHCRYNLTETCVSSLSLNDLQKYVQEDISKTIMSMTLDYGPIVGSSRLKQAILSLYETGTVENITIAHGAINANELVMISLLEPGDHIVSLFPSYQQMYDFPKSLGCEVSLIHLSEEKKWMPTIEDFKRCMRNNTKMICLNSPNNPTGTTLPLSFMKELITLAKDFDCYILCDEIYRGVNTITQTMSPSFSDYYEKAIVTQSLSKVFSFPGLRLGWIKGSKEVVHTIEMRRDYHIISSGPMDDYLACLVLENKEHIIKRSLYICDESKKILKSWLEQEPLVSCVIPDEGTVCFLKYEVDMPSIEFCEKLQAETGIFFVPGSAFGVENHLRFGLTHLNEIKEGLPLFSQWLRQFDK